MHSLMIKLMFLNPQHGFISDRPLSREDVQKLIQLCVEKLSEKNSSSLATIKMQVYFDTNSAPREEIISKNCEAIKTSTAPLIKEIIETTAKTKEDLEKLYRKIVVAVIISSGLGNPTNVGVLKESTGKFDSGSTECVSQVDICEAVFVPCFTAALQSVFPPSELGQFMALSRKDKDQQIMELTHIVTGIRLFNRDCQKGGEGIEDLPNVLQQTITATHSNLQTSLQKLMENVDTLTTALDLGWRHLSFPPADAPYAPPSSPHTTLDLGEDASSEEDEAAEHVKNELSWSDVEHVRDMLITGRQQEVYLRKLLSEVELSRCSLDELLVRLKKRLLQIHDTVRFRTAIPTIQVYVMDHMDNEVLKMMLGDAEVLTDADRLEASMGQTIHRRKTINCGVVDPSYLGFCAWTFVEGCGALIPANQNMGVLRWNGNYYAFSSPDAAYQFDQDPEKKCTHICVEEEWETILEKPPSVYPTKILNPNHPVIWSLVQQETDSFDHASIEASLSGNMGQAGAGHAGNSSSTTTRHIPLSHCAPPVTPPSPAKLDVASNHNSCDGLGFVPRYIKAAANLARVHPELINLLQLHEQMVASRSLGE
uniref:Cilia- and flagella-associated protein 206 n=1 Tax=Timema tahoe TaxID=61484 RepID=A0A7R9NWY4_9NEOP|nr:unnamed protein product [Timema tahoe]